MEDKKTNLELYPVGTPSDITLTRGEVAQHENPAVAEKENEVVREVWGSKLDFILSCVGYAVGLGNVWRFPYLCFSNGGASFLIPYVICLVFCGIPIFYLEVALGQYVQQGVVGAWAAYCPALGGIGLGMVIITFLCSVYYNVIMAWTFYYLFASFQKHLPWESCDKSWNSPLCQTDRKSPPDCVALGVNVSKDDCKWISPEEEYFNKKVLEISPGIGAAGEVRFELAMCLLLGWIIVYFCVWKGIKSAGKVVYFTATFPYLVLFILLIRGATLEGAGEGVIFYLKPDFSKLKNPQVWVQAAGQIFFSLSVGFGGLITYGSYNKFRNNCEKDTLIVSLINCGTSIFAGFVIFTMMGYMSHILGVPVPDVVKGGPGLAFIAYPEGIKQMPASPFWAFIFFFMLFNLGLDSQFVGVETVTTVLADWRPGFRRYKSVITLGFCIVCYFLGLAHVTQGGMYVFQMFDYQAGGISLVLIAFLEAVGIGWFYGTEKFCTDIENMIGHRPNLYFRLCWKYISPVIIGVIFIWFCVDWTGISYNDVKYPGWAEFLGWMLCISAILCVPGYALHRYLKLDSSLTVYERFRTILMPDKEVMSKIEEKEGIRPRYQNVL
ncbi:sodium- and chloride-dependent GABA transporter 2-like isoform X2 [Orbicella faveolata]|uniref:sodium- and chloride-dependent GABA transporter 2-like isoform X2 n=1 Tax=Orbicella faveolata TaxID=48498 RepID=UPI0009E3AC88|nr:sodium- and chloride-dependent GABA transporter 2-like isoform X2 [Orbicella faveolata]